MRISSPSSGQRSRGSESLLFPRHTLRALLACIHFYIAVYALLSIISGEKNSFDARAGKTSPPSAPVATFRCNNCTRFVPTPLSSFFFTVNYELIPFECSAGSNGPVFLFFYRAIFYSPARRPPWGRATATIFYCTLRSIIFLFRAFFRTIYFFIKLITPSPSSYLKTDVLFFINVLVWFSPCNLFKHFLFLLLRNLLSFLFAKRAD